MLSKFFQLVRRRRIFQALRIGGSSVLERVVLIYYRLRCKDGLVLKNILGNKMYLDISEMGIDRELLLTGVHEKLQTEILQKTLNKGMTVVDIGANIGYYVLLEAAIVGEKGKIYAIEPIRRSFELLEKNIEVNNYQQIVETFQMAVSNKSGISKIVDTEQRNNPTMVSPDQRSEYFQRGIEVTTRGAVEIRTITLDEFLEDKRPVDYIRMDIEGYEIEALEGMNRVLGSNRPLTLYFELHPIFLKNPMRIAEKLKELIDLEFKPIAVVHKDGFELIPCKTDNLIETVLGQRVVSVFLQREN